MEIDKIYNMDCLEGMRQMEDGSVDAVVTSPPYYNAMGYAHWDTYQAYLDFMGLVIAEMYRVLNIGRICVINVSCVIQCRAERNDYARRYAIPYHIVGIAENIGFEFLDDIIWMKPEGSASNRGQKFYHLRQPLVYRANNVTEYVLVFRKPGIIPEKVYQSVSPEVKEASIVDGDYFRTNVWFINPNNHMTAIHPATFPIKLPTELIRYYSFQGWIILDPFMGSGTTAVAAIREKRHFIGFELSKEYYDRACKRIAAEQAQLKLF